MTPRFGYNLQGAGNNLQVVSRSPKAGAPPELGLMRSLLAQLPRSSWPTSLPDPDEF